jgi:hypothetical protein
MLEVIAKDWIMHLIIEQKLKGTPPLISPL